MFGVLFQEPFVAQRDTFIQRLSVGGEIHTPVAEFFFQFLQERVFVRAVHIHFVDEEKTRDMVFLQQPPQRDGMALYAVGAADDEDRFVQHLQGAFRFCRKVDVTGGVEQGDRRVAVA